MKYLMFVPVFILLLITSCDVDDLPVFLSDPNFKGEIFNTLYGPADFDPDIEIYFNYYYETGYDDISLYTIAVSCSGFRSYDNNQMVDMGDVFIGTLFPSKLNTYQYYDIFFQVHYPEETYPDSSRMIGEYTRFYIEKYYNTRPALDSSFYIPKAVIIDSLYWENPQNEGIEIFWEPADDFQIKTLVRLTSSLSQSDIPGFPIIWEAEINDSGYYRIPADIYDKIPKGDNLILTIFRGITHEFYKQNNIFIRIISHDKKYLK